MKRAACIFIGLFAVTTQWSSAQHSVARVWNDAILETIRTDFARPTVHARNLFHTSAAMYDAWAVFDPVAEPYFLGKTVAGFACPVEDIPVPTGSVVAAQEEAISYAAYRVSRHRFALSPGRVTSLPRLDSLFTAQSHDIAFTSTDFSTGSPAALGNYIAECIIAFGLRDNSNEPDRYRNTFYEPVNDPLVPEFAGNPTIQDPNRWQPLTLGIFIDQSGNPQPISTPEFLSPEWGLVPGFALDASDATDYTRNTNLYRVYHDPGRPPLVDTLRATDQSDEYLWGFALVAAWSAHLDPSDSTLIDISPASVGNISELPQTLEAYRDFYDFENGGDAGSGYTVNPKTGAAYTPQIVPRADFARVLAEFWADGPDSETPPGHWFTIFNYVSDHPQLEKRFRSVGPALSNLEWDVKGYFALGGAMHDAAIAAWGAKGWYDYIRPISAIRSMADRGQCTDPSKTNFHVGGIPLVPGFIETVESGDSLAGNQQQHVGKIKLRAWRGPDYIEDPQTEIAGVDWILAENWWPYQRPTFITPPFAGYVSGHSTFSRAAAEVLTLFTGDDFFPGGLAEFHAPANNFLVFERGPSVDVTLQWATYRDAAHQSALSRIWGGIHPPADDIPGRKMGEVIGVDAFTKAERYYLGQEGESAHRPELAMDVYPLPAGRGDDITVFLSLQVDGKLEVFDLTGRSVYSRTLDHSRMVSLAGLDAASGFYMVRVTEKDNSTVTAPLVIAD